MDTITISVLPRQITNELKDALASRIVRERARLGWSQHDLAAKARKSVEWVRGYEQKKRWPKSAELLLLGRSLGIRPFELLMTESDTSEPRLTDDPLREILVALAKAPKDVLEEVRALVSLGQSEALGQSARRDTDIG